MSGGDILKAGKILWGYTLEECKPFIDFKIRDVLFREAVLGFMGFPSDNKHPVESKFCKTCKAAGMAKDCTTCSREFTVIDKNKQEIQKVTGHA